MEDSKRERFPEYIPLYYRVFAKIRKVRRQLEVRLAENKAAREGCAGVTPDGEAVCAPAEGVPAGAINRSAAGIDDDLKSPEMLSLAEGLDLLKKEMDSRGYKYTNTAGTFLSRMFYPRSERTKLWENLWVIHHSGVKPGHKVLDIGGASTAFTFYLANIGCSVSVVDNDWGNCGTIYNANYAAKKMGWDMKVYDRDISQPLPFPDDHFDRVFSICTLEHLTSDVRQYMMKEVGRVLKPGGIAGLTMCYCNEMDELTVDKGLRFAYRDKLEKDVILPSGLDIYGNKELLDHNIDEDFLGALFLRKTI